MQLEEGTSALIAGEISNAIQAGDIEKAKELLELYDDKLREKAKDILTDKIKINNGT